MNATLLSALLLLAAATPALPKVTFDARPLGVTATVRTVGAQKREDTPDFFPPRHVRVALGPQGDEVRELNVYPVAGLIAQYPGMRDGVRTEIGSLRALLRERPVPAEIRGELPFLPLPFAGQVLSAAVKYLDFPGGRGVRYLVGFSQDVSPLSREQVFYTFQGITNDGRHYVSLQYPVPLKELPQDAFSGPNRPVMDALNSGDQARASAAWKAYLARTKGQLNALANDPRLTKIDTFVGSLRIR
ncbi:hypothetical protein DAETH_41480 (plasmid) [Deinococcus aetherius]|uniref:Uncharacterized protein n=1 Tax=Deinococcus aetherius TaxID=200252 RepID=A0ABM8AK30_9DEIO|nr:hypothetical protein [Deinococcus aetherius]BDP44179.1 hypothetical protein DAETH_41480 [Deinococcus aetherius]